MATSYPRRCLDRSRHSAVITSSPRLAPHPLALATSILPCYKAARQCRNLFDVALSIRSTVRIINSSSELMPGGVINRMRDAVLQSITPVLRCFGRGRDSTCFRILIEIPAKIPRPARRSRALARPCRPDRFACFGGHQLWRMSDSKYFRSAAQRVGARNSGVVRSTSPAAPSLITPRRSTARNLTHVHRYPDST